MKSTVMRHFLNSETSAILFWKEETKSSLISSIIKSKVFLLNNITVTVYTHFQKQNSKRFQPPESLFQDPQCMSSISQLLDLASSCSSQSLKKTLLLEFTEFKDLLPFSSSFQSWKMIVQTKIIQVHVLSGFSPLLLQECV